MNWYLLCVREARCCCGVHAFIVRKSSILFPGTPYIVHGRGLPQGLRLVEAGRRPWRLTMTGETPTTLEPGGCCVPAEKKQKSRVSMMVGRGHVAMLDSTIVMVWPSPYCESFGFYILRNRCGRQLQHDFQQRYLLRLFALRDLRSLHMPSLTRT